MDTAAFLEHLRRTPKHKLAQAVAALPEHVARALLDDLNQLEQGGMGRLAYQTPGDLMRQLNPQLRLTPALRMLNRFLVDAISKPDSRNMVTFAPQEGKSTTVSVWLPIFTLMTRPEWRIIIACATQSLAESFVRQARDIIRANPQLGLRISPTLNRQGEFQLDGHRGGIYAVGVGGTLNGRPCDLMVIDDPNKDFEEASSPTVSRKVFEWYQGTAAMRLAPGAPVIVLQTRWHQNDLIGRLLHDAPDRWELLRIPAQADHRPELGETDPLGREPGEFMESARGRTTAQWEQRKREAGPRMFAAQFQGTPSPDEGGIFPGEWERYSAPLWEQRPDGARIVPGIGRPDHELVQSWDFTFSDTSGSDFVVGQVWLRVGPRAFLLDMVRARMNFPAMLQAVRDLTARWPQAQTTLVEAKASGQQIIDSLRLELPNAFIPIKPTESKVTRANAVSAFAFAGNIVLPVAHLLPSVGEMVEELKLFPASSHDDTVDAMTQAVSQLLLYRIDEGEGETVELFDDYTIAPYAGLY